MLYLYGAYKENSVPTAASNEAFDQDLRRRNPEWGVRSLEEVAGLASTHGLELVERILMPANNLGLVFRRQETRSQRPRVHCNSGEAKRQFQAPRRLVREAVPVLS